MKALHFGAGKIGRGFIGALLCQSGYEVTFADAQPLVVEAMNRDGGYDIHLVGDEPSVQHIGGISAILASSDEAVA